MITSFSDIEYKQSLKRVRIFLLSTFICCLTYFFVITKINPDSFDYLPGRILVCMISLAGFITSFFGIDDRYKAALLYLRVASISFMLLYMYLLHINHWSLFYCWSYFVLAAILSSSSISWEFYLFHSLLGFTGPLILGFFSPLTPLELFHFHSANLVVFSLIGISVYTNYQYKKEVEKLTNGLIEQSKMAALGEMAGGISHEINNPLAVIKGAIEQMKRLPPQNKEDAEKFNILSDKISRMVNRITRITGGLKEFSQDNSDQSLELNDLNDLIDDGIRLSIRMFNDLETDIVFNPTDKAMCLCKKNQIVQIIFKLCTNAIEATNNSASPLINITLGIEKDFYVIAISDNGVGISDANATKVMEPFFTTKEIGSGIGLGLSAAHGFAKVHGGELLLERNKLFTRFILKLPTPHSIQS
ncbi:MAG: hypothetical protein H7177_04160 [Rhizobacter sp.]|nr:hypothetical protein [Bacteriovorax sp.]